MREVADNAVNKVMTMVDDPNHSASIKRSSFESALDGIRTGKMTYKGDALLPLIQNEMADKLQEYANLSKAEEQELLRLTEQQKGLIAQSDRSLKNEFL